MTQLADVFSNRYEIQRGIARGGMAEVYLARDQLLDRPVAVKVLFAEYARDPSFVERFRREAQSAANLNHPNIVAIYDWGQERGTYFIVMEYVRGRALRDVVQVNGPFSARRTAEIGAAEGAAIDEPNGVEHALRLGGVRILRAGVLAVLAAFLCYVHRITAEMEATVGGNGASWIGLDSAYLRADPL